MVGICFYLFIFVSSDLRLIGYMHLNKLNFTRCQVVLSRLQKEANLQVKYDLDVPGAYNIEWTLRII